MRPQGIAGRRQFYFKKPYSPADGFIFLVNALYTAHRGPAIFTPLSIPLAVRQGRCYIFPCSTPSASTVFCSRFACAPVRPSVSIALTFAVTSSTLAAIDYSALSSSSLLTAPNGVAIGVGHPTGCPSRAIPATSLLIIRRLYTAFSMSLGKSSAPDAALGLDEALEVVPLLRQCYIHRFHTH